MDNTFDKMFYERGDLIGGVDESGIRDLAGPIVASCVVLPKIDLHKIDLRIFEICDSKVTPEKFRKRDAERVWQIATAIGVGEAAPHEIDYLGKTRAAQLARNRSIAACQTLETKKTVIPDFILVDGTKLLDTDIPQIGVKQGDSKSLVVACASIVAKVYRDNIMAKLHERFPYYNWISNKGNASEHHYKALDEYGIIPGVHRINCWPFSGTINSKKSVGIWEKRKLWKEQTNLRLTKELK